jgi:hypothetical protein
LTRFPGFGQILWHANSMPDERKYRGPDLAKKLPLPRVADALLELQKCRGHVDKMRRFARSTPTEHDHIASFPRVKLKQSDRFIYDPSNRFRAERLKEFEKEIRNTVELKPGDNKLLELARDMVCMAYMLETEVEERKQIANALNKSASAMEAARTTINTILDDADDKREDISTQHRKHLREVVLAAETTLIDSNNLRGIAVKLADPEEKAPFTRARLLASLVLALSKSGIEPQHAAVVLSPTTKGETRRNARNRYKKLRISARRAV